MRATKGAKAPDVAEEILLLEDTLGVLGEVDLEVAHREACVPRAGSPAQDRAHTCDQLVVDERAHDVVVAASREATHAVDRVAARAHHDHRHVSVPGAARLAFTEAAADLEAGAVWEEVIVELSCSDNLHGNEAVSPGRTRGGLKHVQITQFFRNAEFLLKLPYNRSAAVIVTPKKLVKEVQQHLDDEQHNPWKRDPQGGA
jgi:hypothetical protein